MCDLTKSLKKKNFKGYKVVAEGKDGKNYSVAMGFCYDDFDQIPGISKQKRISNFFNNNILSSRGYGFSQKMVGRTAVFVNAHDAADLVRRINEESRYIKPEFCKKRIKVKQATVSRAMMSGEYENREVVAGRKIKIGEELGTKLGASSKLEYERAKSSLRVRNYVEYDMHLYNALVHTLNISALLHKHDKVVDEIDDENIKDLQTVKLRLHAVYAKGIKEVDEDIKKIELATKKHEVR